MAAVIGCALGLLHSPIAAALNPELATTQYQRQVWQTEQGLPQNFVSSIVQTRDGYLWMGTQEGLARFDGVRFTVFNKANTPGIKHDVVWKLLEDHKGALWIATRGGGLSRYQDGNFSNFSKADGLADDSVQSICEAPDGSLWAGTRSGGVSRYKDGKFSTLSKKEGLASDVVFATYADPQGVIWMGTDGGGLSRWQNGQFSTITKANGLANDTVYAIFQDHLGTLWVGTNGGLSRYKDGVWSSFTAKDGLANDNIRALTEDHDGNLWIGTDGGGLVRFSNGKFSTLGSKQGLSNDNVGALLEDREGNLWVGTDAGGVNRLNSNKFTSYTSAEGLSNDNARSIYQDAKGLLWVGTFGGLNRFADGRFTAFTVKDGLASDVVLSIVEDQAGSLWLGTLGAGLSRYAEGKFTNYGAKQGLSNNTVLASYADADGTVWFGTRSGGLNRFRDGKLSSFSTADGLSSNDIRVITRSRDTSLWIGTLGGGLNRYKDGKFTAFTEKDGLAKDQVLSLHEDVDGVLWIGTFGGGLSRYKNGKFSNYTAKNGLFDDVIYQILEDASGKLWMSSNKGVFSIARSALDAFADGKLKALQPAVYGKADGMSSTECNGAHQPAGWKTRDGRLWFPTVKGVVSIDPEHIASNTLPPPAVIEQVLIDDQPLPAKAGTELPADTRKFEFRYAGLSYVAPEKVRFRYRLDGFDKDWVEAGSLRTAYYTNLGPGEYRFQVMASNNDGVWSKTGASFSFVRKPYLYQQKLFYFVYVLIALGLVQLGQTINRKRVRRLQEREQELLTLIAERERAETQLRAQKEDLQRTNAELEQFAYVASHDLQEPLRAVSSYSQLLTRRFVSQAGTDAQEFVGYITESVQRMRDLLEGLVSYSKVSRHHQLLTPVALGALLSEALEYLHGAIASSGAEVRCGVLPTLPVDAAELTQVFQHLIGNAIKFRSEQPPLVEVSAEQQGGVWEFTVRDNGIGIDAEHADRIFVLFQRLHTRDVYAGNGLGLSICKKIVERHGGRIWLKPGGPGTTIQFSLPA